MMVHLLTRRTASLTSTNGMNVRESLRTSETRWVRDTKNRPRIFVWLVKVSSTSVVSLLGNSLWSYIDCIPPLL